MKTPMMTALALPLGITLLACGDGTGGGYDIDDGPLSGMVAGQSFTLAQGHTNWFLSDDEGFFGTFFGTSYEPCSDFDSPSDEAHLLGNIPTELGEHNFGLSQNLTFYDPNDNSNLIATTGVIVVDAITDTEVSGGIYAYYDEDNEVSGQFTVDICPEQ